MRLGLDLKKLATEEKVTLSIDQGCSLTRLRVDLEREKLSKSYL